MKDTANVSEVIWMRLGDADDYHAHDGLDDVANVLAEFGIGDFDRYCLYGVSAPGFRGNNYISLYFGPDPGDGSAEASRELTDAELTELQKNLDHRHGAHATGAGR